MKKVNLSEYTFGRGKAEIVLAKILNEKNDLAATKYTSRMLVQATNVFNNILVSNLSKRMKRYLLNIVLYEFEENINHSKLSNKYGNNSDVVTFLKNCLKKRFKNSLILI